jgi:hypothetical protein
LTVSENTVLATWLATSATCAVKIDVPAAVGVPLMTPVEAFRLRPAGKPPLVIDQVFGAVPPLAARV